MHIRRASIFAIIILMLDGAAHARPQEGWRELEDGAYGLELMGRGLGMRRGYG